MCEYENKLICTIVRPRFTENYADENFQRNHEVAFYFDTTHFHCNNVSTS